MSRQTSSVGFSSSICTKCPLSRATLPYGGLLIALGRVRCSVRKNLGATKAVFHDIHVGRCGLRQAEIDGVVVEPPQMSESDSILRGRTCESSSHYLYICTHTLPSSLLRHHVEQTTSALSDLMDISADGVSPATNQSDSRASRPDDGEQINIAAFVAHLDDIVSFSSHVLL